jgi:glucose/mannose-6-phosphate isomerase
MFLDQPEKFAAIDPQHMLGHIDALPDQLANAFAHAQQQDLPADFAQARMIVLTGMGGSAIGGDYLAALVEDAAPVPVLVNRGYTLPAYVRGPEVLVIASSHSGNTEETLAAFDEAQARGVKLMALSTGGKLSDKARQIGVPLWSFTYDSQPRAAFGWSFGLLVGLAHRLGLAGDLSADVQEAVDLLRQSRDHFGANVPIHQNAPKRYAGQVCGRIGVTFGAGLLAPVARRWKGQMNENAKNWAEFDMLPEQNHNGVAGIDNPEKALERLFVFFLQSSYDHPRVTLRHKLTHQLFMQEGIGVDTFTARGESRLAQMMNATQFGDYLSYYLAMLNSADPTPIPPISMLKEGLAQA